MRDNGQDMNGACLCGAVTVSAHLPGNEVQACHCRQCQTWTGGGPLWAIRAKDVTFGGDENIATYHASEHGERAFCKICGTTLYWKLQGRSVAFLPVGLVPDQGSLRVTEEIFVDHRPGWLTPFSKAKQQDEATMQAQLAAFLAKEGSHA